MKEGCKYLEGVLCEAFAGSASAFSRCEMPDILGTPCPIAVSQTGDIPFAQAVTEYREIVARTKRSYNPTAYIQFLREHPNW